MMSKTKDLRRRKVILELRFWERETSNPIQKVLGESELSFKVLIKRKADLLLS